MNAQLLDIALHAHMHLHKDHDSDDLCKLIATCTLHLQGIQDDKMGEIQYDQLCMNMPQRH